MNAKLQAATMKAMKIHGLVKLTLIDYPGKTACTLFTGGCNFRCPFCHNAGLVLSPGNEPVVSEEEIFSYLSKRRGILDGVCLTGGEPLLFEESASLLARIKSMGFLVKLDTNGSFPERLQSIVEKGYVDYVAMDIKNSLESYGRTIGIEGYDTRPIEQSVSFLLEGRTDYEFRTTVVRELHSLEDFHSIGKWIAKARSYYLQAFADSGNIIEKGLSAYSKNEMEGIRKLLETYIEAVYLREQ